MSELSKHNPTGRFTGLAQTYAKHRPSYPDAAIEYIMQRCGLSSASTIVDIGSGTGISSRLLAHRGPTVIGVEPNDEMREQAESDSLLLDNVSFHKGTAEETELIDGLADAVVCAQAFHWFQPSTALAEFKRILKPGGWAILMWNERGESDSFTREYGDILRTLPETAAVEVPRRTAGQALLDSPIYTNQELKYFESVHIVDREGIIGRAASASYVPKEPQAFAALSAKLTTLFDKYANDGRVPFVYETSVYTGQST